MGSLFSSVKSTLAWGNSSKAGGGAEASEAADQAKPAAAAPTGGSGPDGYSQAKQQEEHDPLMMVKAMMINKDDGDGPSAEDVDDYARNVLEMDVEKYPHLVWIAEEALLQTELPKGWAERVDGTGRTFYKNKSTKETTFVNPIDTAHKSLYQVSLRGERAKEASRRAKDPTASGSVEARAMARLVQSHEGQVAILLHFYKIVDGGRTEEDIDQILKKRWHNDASALSGPQWDGLAEKMKQKYSQCPMLLWKESVTSVEIEHSDSVLRELDGSMSSAGSPSPRATAKQEQAERAERMNLQRLQSRLR